MAVQLPQAVVDALDLKPGDDLEVVYAASGRIEIKKHLSKSVALQRMRKRGWRIPDDYVFDREKANSR